MALSLLTPWDDLLDAASDGGLEPHIIIGGAGHGSLAFQIWLDDATPAGLESANLATEMFDAGGQAATEIFEHCLNMGCVYREFADMERISFVGPMAQALADIRTSAETLQ